ncbi:MAG: YaiI/YqxD family protein [Planctomycetota bacterium]|nr:YaiI/YqxD family protein [Planctomycetota bacterium]
MDRAMGNQVGQIFVDADACPVKAEVARVALRCKWTVFYVSNSGMNIPKGDGLELVVVDGGFDAADDWIAERARAGDLVVTADIPLASRCVKAGARVLDFKGGEFSEASIGEAVARREILAKLREMGMAAGGPAPFDKRDRSAFLQRMDQVLRKLSKLP